MFQVLTSKTLIKPLAKLVKPAKITQAAFSWRAELALIGDQACVVVEELYSHYIMVFCGIDNQDFAHFQDLFSDRFCREMSAICAQANLYDSTTLFKLILPMTQPQHYQLDPEPLEEGKIIKTIEKLERQFLYEKRALPINGKAAFEFTFAMNNRTAKSADAVNKRSPAQVIGDYCLNLVEEKMRNSPQPTESKNPLVSERRDNIIQVDFGGNRVG